MASYELCCMEQEDFLQHKIEQSKKRPNRLVISKDAKKKMEGESLPEALEKLEARQLGVEKSLDEDFLLEVGLNDVFYDYMADKVKFCYGLRPENEALGPLAECIPAGGICSCVCQMEDFKSAFQADRGKWVLEMVKKPMCKKGSSDKKKK